MPNPANQPLPRAHLRPDRAPSRATQQAGKGRAYVSRKKSRQSGTPSANAPSRAGGENGMGRFRLRAAVIATRLGSPLGGMGRKRRTARHYSFAYDQPHSTGYGIAADLFNSKLMEISCGSMAVDQFPGRATGAGAPDAGKDPDRRHRLHDQFDRQRGDRRAGIKGAVDPLIFSAPKTSSIKAIADPRAGRGGAGNVRRDRQGRARVGARHARASRPVRQEAGGLGRRPEGLQGAGPGDADRGHAVPRLWGADRRTCRSAASTRRSRPGSSTSPRME